MPILLFYIRGSRAGLYGLLFIIGQLTLFFPLSTYVLMPHDDELQLLPAAHKWFVMLMTYLIVGVTAFVHETSRSKGIVKLRRREELNEQLQEAAEAKTGLLLNISHGATPHLHGVLRHFISPNLQPWWILFSQCASWFPLLTPICNDHCCVVGGVP